jgi:hypothetical protein
LSSPLACLAATTWAVDSCDGDTVSGVSTTGTLRYAIANAATSGDTVSLTGLTGLNACAGSTISITTGEIFIDKESLTIIGPGASNLAIDGSGLYSGPSGPYNSRVFTHTGSGTLTIQNLSVTGGHVYHVAGGYPSRGGCIYSAGSVTLLSSAVTSCSARQGGGYVAAGGGIYTKDSLSLYSSILNDNTVYGGITSGGGARVLGSFYANSGTVSNNKVGSGSGIGGGVNAGRNVFLTASTISRNYSAGMAGGIAASSNPSAGYTLAVTNSTISGNSAGSQVGGLYANSGMILFFNSTIAFNTASSYPGVQLAAVNASSAVTLQSTLMSNNTYPSGAENDLNTYAINGHTITINGGVPANPAYNLIRVSFASGLPNDTKSFGACPLLGPLRNNGGLTKTHALLSHSVAIDAGNNVAEVLGLPFDQRGGASTNGTVDYPRVSGLLPDIGAYEVQQDDVMFNADFDGCPDLPI